MLTSEQIKESERFSEEMQITPQMREYFARIGRKGGKIGGKIGGKSTSKRKQDSARANGHKGGRPKRPKNSNETV